MIINRKYNIGHICTRKQSDLDTGEKMAIRRISQHMKETHHSLIDRTSMFLRFAIYIFLILICATCAEASNDGSAADRTVLEGRLLQISKLPAPKNNPYPDCNYTAVIDVAQIIRGKSTPKKLVLVLPGFVSRKHAPEAHYKRGDKVRATIVPFASMSATVRQTQLADEVEDFTLSVYYPEEISTIKKIQAVRTPVPFAKEEPREAGVRNDKTIDREARGARQQAIKQDLDEIERLLTKNGGNWDRWYASLGPYHQSYAEQQATMARMWVDDSFFTAGEVDYNRVYHPSFVKSLIAFKNYLAARNVDLILVRVPKKGELVDDLFATPSPDGVFNPYLLQMYKELLSADVEIVADIIPKAKAARLRFPLMYWYQDFLEDHPAEGITRVIAEELSKRVNRYELVRSHPKKSFTLKKVPTQGGWLNFNWPYGNPNFSPTENVQLSGVVDDQGNPVQLKQGTDSPVLILGSSYISVPSFAQGSSIPHYFAYLTGIVPDLVHRMEADFMIPRSIAHEGDAFLMNRSVCIFPFVPITAYRPLASLPILDPEKSSKTLLNSYSGQALQKLVSFQPGTSRDIYSYAQNGSLVIQPGKGGGVTSGSFDLKVPESANDFQHLITEIEFDSKDRTSLILTYSGQTDFLKRSDTQVKNNELFAFVTNRSVDSLNIRFFGSPNINTPTVIKSINFHGVKKAAFY